MHIFTYDSGRVIQSTNDNSFRYEVQFAPFRVTQYVDGILVNVMNDQDSLYFENSAYYHGEKDIAASGKLTEREDCFEETAEYINGYFSASDVSESRMWATSKVKKLFNTNKFLLPAEYLTKTQTIDFKQTVGVSFLLHSHYLYGLP